MTNIDVTPEPKVLQVRVRTEDGSALQLYSYEDGNQELTIKLTDEVLQFVIENHGSADYGTHEILLAKYDAKPETLTTYPCSLQPGSPYFSEPKYARVRRISLEGARPILDDGEGGYGDFSFRQFPSGFVDDPFDGLGLIYMLRFIVEAVENLDGVEEICICKDDATSVNESVFRLPEAIYETARKTLGRTHRAAVTFANEEKRTFLRSRR